MAAGLSDNNRRRLGRINRNFFLHIHASKVHPHSLRTDYTFGLGNGINVMTEAFGYLQGENPFSTDQKLWFGLLSVNYPINIIHNVNAMLFYDIGNKNLYRFINWSVAYDKWSFYLIGFWNPESYTLYNVDPRTSLYGGWGFQLMAVFNH